MYEYDTRTYVQEKVVIVKADILKALICSWTLSHRKHCAHNVLRWKYIEESQIQKLFVHPYNIDWIQYAIGAW